MEAMQLESESGKKTIQRLQLVTQTGGIPTQVLITLQHQEAV